MAQTSYWFSAKQKRMRDALGGDTTYVKVNDAWVEYTQHTEGDKRPTVWPDFRLVAEGDGLECKSLKNENSDDSALFSASASARMN